MNNKNVEEDNKIIEDLNDYFASGRGDIYNKEENLDIKNKIKQADEYLLYGGEEPSWLSSFLENNITSLRKNIYRISSKDTITEIEKYSENYFNEIIQNANDLNYENENNKIIIECSKENINSCIQKKYKLTGIYNDKGFSTSDIFSFLNVNMSNKSKKQTGKYGVGIKSLFLFVDSLEIKSNIYMKFEKYNETEGERRKCIGKIKNDSWREKPNRTQISISYKDNEDLLKANTNKLSNLIDYLCGEISMEEEEIRELLYDGNNKECIFDIRSLMFMNNEYPIKEIEFKGKKENGEKKKIKIKCKKYKETDVTTENRKYSIIKKRLTLKIDDLKIVDDDYLLFLDKEKNIIFAFLIVEPNDNKSKKTNYYYSTYRLKEIENNIYSFPLYINSSYSNQQRTDLGSDIKEISNAKSEINSSLKSVLKLMVSDEICKNVDDEILQDLSKVFHYIVLKEMEQSPNYEDSFLNHYIEYGFNNKNLPIIKNDSHIYEVDNIIILEKDTSENACFEMYKYFNLNNRYNNIYISDKNNYTDFEEENEKEWVSSIIQLTYKKLFNGFINSKVISEKYYKLLNCFRNEEEYISYILNEKKSIFSFNGEVSTDKINKYIEKFNKNEDIENILKLIGKYNIVDFIDENGKIDSEKFSLKSYIFTYSNNKENPIIYTQNERYDMKYKELKEKLNQNKYLFKNKNNDWEDVMYLMIPESCSRRNWNHIRDCEYYETYSKEVSVDNKDRIMLLKAILNDKKLRDNIFYSQKYIDSIVLVEKMQFEYRSKYFVNYHNDEYQHVINLDKFFKFDIKNDDINIENDDINIENIFYYLTEVIKKIYEEKDCRMIDLMIDSIKVNHYIEELREYSKNNFYIMFKRYNEVKLLLSKKIYNLEIKKINLKRQDIIGDEKRKFIKKLLNKDIDIYSLDNRSGLEDEIIVISKDGIELEKGSGSGFIKIGEVKEIEKDRIYILFNTKKKSVNDVIKYVLNRKVCEEKKYQLNWVESFIKYENTSFSLDDENYEIIKGKINNINKLDSYEKFNWQNGSIKDIKKFKYEFIKTLLESRGNYNKYCPICGQAVDDRRLITIINGDNKGDNKSYIITIGCEDCFKVLKYAKSAKIEKDHILSVEIDLRNMTNKVLKKELRINLSPINIKIIDEFNNYINNRGNIDI